MRGRTSSKYKPDGLRGEGLDSWSRHPLTELIVSDERAAWIQARYPVEDFGRPGILVIESRAKGRSLARQPIQYSDDEEELAA